MRILNEKQNQDKRRNLEARNQMKNSQEKRHLRPQEPIPVSWTPESRIVVRGIGWKDGLSLTLPDPWIRGRYTTICPPARAKIKEECKGKAVTLSSSSQAQKWHIGAKRQEPPINLETSSPKNPETQT